MRFTIKWRLLALFGIALYVLTIAALFILIFRNLLFALALLFTAILLATAGWQIFTGTGKRYWRGIGLGVLGVTALIAEVLFFAKGAKNIRTLLVVVATAMLYAWLFAVLRRQYWREKQSRGLHATGANFKKPVLIINPKSGNGRAIKAHVQEAAERLGISVVTLQPGNDVESVARAAVNDGADILGISGGDGSIGAVAKVAIKSRLPLVVLPGGTRCHFARDLGLNPAHIRDALAGFHGVERYVDVGSINGRIFLNNVSFGMYADIVDHPEYRDNKLAVSREVLRGVLSGERPPYDLQIDMGDKHFPQAVLILIGVNPYNTINLLELGHRESLDSGRLQINLFKALDDTLARDLVQNLSFNHLRKNPASNKFEQWDARATSIASCESAIVVGVDGEREVYKTPVVVRCLPGALRLFVPPEDALSRSRSPFHVTNLRKMWQVARS